MKKFISILTASILLAVFASTANAASLSIRLENPETPTHDQDHKLSFVALDIEGRSISVSCYVKKPNQGSFIQYDATKYLTSGGNNGYCQVNGDQVSESGTYEFYVKAIAGTDSVNSNTVSFDYNNSTPDTPVSYSKEKIEDCKYKISFKTADDGKTTKVEIYRSEDSSFKLENSTRVGSVNIGPDESGEYTDVPPDCGKNYFYAIRAFDSDSSASGSIGDSTIITETTTETTGAIPVSESYVGEGSQGQILGESTEEESKDATESSKSMESADESNSEGEILGILSKNKNTRLFLLGILVLAIIFTYSRRKDK